MPPLEQDDIALHRRQQQQDEDEHHGRPQHAMHPERRVEQRFKPPRNRHDRKAEDKDKEHRRAVADIVLAQIRPAIRAFIDDGNRARAVQPALAADGATRLQAEGNVLQ